MSDTVIASDTWSQTLSVQAVPVSNAGQVALYRLDIYDGSTCIGEYERSKATHIERKKQEIQCAARILRITYAQHGAFSVRWIGEAGNRRKEIRSQKDGRVLGTIPRQCWGKS